MDIYIALVHYPVHNRRGERVATAVTNLDIHDLLRAARTYDIRETFFITPIAQQRSLISRIIEHWRTGDGAVYNRIRAQAFERARTATDVDEASAAIEAETGDAPIRVVTGARLGAAPTDTIIEYDDLRRLVLNHPNGAGGERPLLLLFGTGWGLTADFIAGCDYGLPGIHAVAERQGYNHLSVRSAVAIVLDRLLGAR